ncbi:MAG: hypothetical protein U5K71_10275 [Gracilimonas sp.]|nr:hypothetical protein [Gracilimonas sp.]
MRYLTTISGVLVCILALVACQPQQSNEPRETVTGGMIMSGELSGSEFAIATGSEMDTFMTIVERFNQMDAAGIWEFSADTVSMIMIDGSTQLITQAAFEGMFSAIDSLSWEMDAVVPLKVVGTDLVKVMVDSREVMYMKDGSVSRVRLFEEFTFDSGILTNVRQWSADMPEGM